MNPSTDVGDLPVAPLDQRLGIEYLEALGVGAGDVPQRATGQPQNLVDIADRSQTVPLDLEPPPLPIDGHARRERPAVGFTGSPRTWQKPGIARVLVPLSYSDATKGEPVPIEYVSAPDESQPPVPEGPRLCNGDDMRIVHNAFLWGYEQAAELVRSAPAGDTDRSEYVGQWLADLDATLHIHHEGEDELLWGKLEQRAPACTLHVGQMRAHHAQVAELLAEAGPLLTQWRATADPETGQRLADAYERMLDVLKVHLRREVVEIVPVVEKVLSQKEWEGLAEHGLNAIPKSRLLPQLGMLLANSSPADRAPFFAALPGPVKFLWRLVGRRQYAKQYRTLFPGQPVPQTI